MTEQILSMFTHQIAQTTARQRVVPSLELFEHIYHSPNQHFRALMRGRAGEPLWEALQTALCERLNQPLHPVCRETFSVDPSASGL